MCVLSQKARALHRAFPRTINLVLFLLSGFLLDAAVYGPAALMRGPIPVFPSFLLILAVTCAAMAYVSYRFRRMDGKLLALQEIIRK